MRVGVLIDGGRIARWQADALLAIAERSEFLFYDCANSRSARRWLAHGLYYLLNLISIRNSRTAQMPVPPELATAGIKRFTACRDGAWEELPADVLEQIKRDAPDVLVKFGMGLLRVPPPEDLPAPILSYHHGDPRKFRGRPAGFYELLSGEPVMGQVVQILSNRLDAGAVVAFAKTKVHRHSYRKTLTDAYRMSPLLLKPAIANALAAHTLPIQPAGRNYRLPSNATVMALAGKLLTAKLRRLAYGAFVEKKWRIAKSALPADWSPNCGLAGEWAEIALSRRYHFLADPFFDPGSGAGILAEAMRFDGLGEIVRIDGSGTRPIGIEGGHCSYPSTISANGRHFVLAETSEWASPTLFELDGGQVKPVGEVDIAGRPRLFDPTMHLHEGTAYLFGNRSDEGDGVLRLWVADSIFGPFTEHPESPVRISPAGARMGGLILDQGGTLLRIGQDLRGAYGDGLIFFAIEALTRTTYRETRCGGLRFSSHRGPHTLNIRDGIALFDYYDDRFSPLAGLRRIGQSRAS